MLISSEINFLLQNRNTIIESYAPDSEQSNLCTFRNAERGSDSIVSINVMMQIPPPSE